MDLSKGFDTVNHELLLAKLHTYDFNKDAYKTIRSYLKQGTKQTRFLVPGVKST